MESSMTYLGLPIIIGRSKSQIFNFVKQRLWNNLNGWKERTLSQAGRKVLIKAIIQAIPSYVMGCFRLPNAICDHIKSLTARLFWSGNAQEWKMHWLNSKKLTTSKKKGGLGFHMSMAFNQHLLAKQWWRMLTFSNSLITKVLKSKYFP